MIIIVNKCPHCGHEIHTAVMERPPHGVALLDDSVWPPPFERRFTLQEFVQKFFNTDMAGQILILEFKVSSIKDHLQRIINHL